MTVAGRAGAPAALALLALLGACREPQRLAYAHESAARGSVVLDGERIAGLVHDHVRGLAVWPVFGPAGIPVTRGFPFADVEGEPRDHPHHAGLWFAHGKVNGTDFWAGAGRIEKVGVTQLSGQHVAVAHRWVAADGRHVAADQRWLRFDQGRTEAGSRWRSIDSIVQLQAAHGPLRIGDTKEGTFALRLRPELCLEGEGATGSLRNAAGDRDRAAWGKRARWIAWEGTAEGAVVTVAMFDHPGNHGHPTHWHARGYGLSAANPFGAHDFAGMPAGTGDHVVDAGGMLTFRHLVWMAEGQQADAALDALWQRWARQLDWHAD